MHPVLPTRKTLVAECVSPKGGRATLQPTADSLRSKAGGSRRIATILLLIIVCLSLSLAGCGENGSGAQAQAGNRITDATLNEGRLRIVTTNFVAYDFARQIGGEQVVASLLLPPGAESHSFEPTPGDIIAIQDCDLFVFVGGESEAWVEDILESLDTGRLHSLKMMDCTQTVVEQTVEGMQVEAGQTPTYDEHVWTSPRNARAIVETLSQTLIQLDPANASTYEANTRSYIAKLDALDAEFRRTANEAKRHTLVFGDRFPFRYLADAYGLEYYAAFPGCSTESEASPRTIVFLIEKVRAEHIPVVLKIELSSQGIAETIAEETGTRVLVLHSVHNLSLDERESGATYLSLMEHNVEVLREALN